MRFGAAATMMQPEGYLNPVKSEFRGQRHSLRACAQVQVSVSYTNAQRLLPGDGPPGAYAGSYSGTEKSTAARAFSLLVFTE